jgi:hypothetical protein
MGVGEGFVVVFNLFCLSFPNLSTLGNKNVPEYYHLAPQLRKKAVLDKFPEPRKSDLLLICP